MRQRFSWLVVAVISVLVASGCGGGSTGTGGTSPASPKPGGTLTIGLSADPGPIDPIAVGGTVSGQDVYKAVFGTLLYWKPDGTMIPGLASSWKVSTDGTTVTVTLRPGLKFHDGTQLDAAAMKFTADRYLDPKNKAPFIGQIPGLQSVTTDGAQNVVFHLKAPDASFISALAGQAGMPVSPAGVAKWGADFGRHPVGAGPFKFESSVPGSSVTLTKFADYWDKGAPYLDKLVFQSIPDGSSRFASLQSRQIQDSEDPSVVQIQQAKSDSGLKVDSLGALSTQFVVFNMSKPPFSSIDARNAVSYATNAPELDKALYNNLYAPAYTMFPAGSPWQNGIPKNYPSFDLNKSTQLVKGMSGGLSFTLSVINDPTNLQLAQALQAQWTKAGIKVTLAPQEAGTVVKNQTAGNFEAELARWRGAIDPEGNDGQFFRSTSNSDISRFNSSEVDQLLDQARQTIDVAKRKTLYTQIDQLISDQRPFFFLWSYNWYRLHLPSVQGIPFLPDGSLELSHAWVQ